MVTKATRQTLPRQSWRSVDSARPDYARWMAEFERLQRRKQRRAKALAVLQYALVGAALSACTVGFWYVTARFFGAGFGG